MSHLSPNQASDHQWCRSKGVALCSSSSWSCWVRTPHQLFVTWHTRWNVTAFISRPSGKEPMEITGRKEDHFKKHGSWLDQPFVLRIQSRLSSSGSSNQMVAPFNRRCVHQNVGNKGPDRSSRTWACSHNKKPNRGIPTGNTQTRKSSSATSKQHGENPGQTLTGQGLKMVWKDTKCCDKLSPLQRERLWQRKLQLPWGYSVSVAKLRC